MHDCLDGSKAFYLGIAPSPWPLYLFVSVMGIQPTGLRGRDVRKLDTDSDVDDGGRSYDV